VRVLVKQSPITTDIKRAAMTMTMMMMTTAMASLTLGYRRTQTGKMKMMRTKPKSIRNLVWQLNRIPGKGRRWRVVRSDFCHFLTFNSYYAVQVFCSVFS